MSMWAVTQTDRFKAAVAAAGISDWLSYYGENGIDAWMIPYFGKSAYDDPAVYGASSAINYMHNVKTRHSPTSENTISSARRRKRRILACHEGDECADFHHDLTPARPWASRPGASRGRRAAHARLVRQVPEIRRCHQKSEMVKTLLFRCGIDGLRMILSIDKNISG